MKLTAATQKAIDAYNAKAAEDFMSSGLLSWEQEDWPAHDCTVFVLMDDCNQWLAFHFVDGILTLAEDGNPLQVVIPKQITKPTELKAVISQVLLKLSDM